jgi:DNA excision repair protein ERCC-4
MSPGDLLSFHLSILEEIHDPSTSQFVLLARGLGLRKIVCTLMQIYDQPSNLVLLVNASSDEEAAIGEELGIMGCRKPGLRSVGYEMGKKDRYVASFAPRVECVCLCMDLNCKTCLSWGRHM